HLPHGEDPFRRTASPTRMAHPTGRPQHPARREFCPCHEAPLAHMTQAAVRSTISEVGRKLCPIPRLLPLTSVLFHPISLRTLTSAKSTVRRARIFLPRAYC